MFPSKMTKGTIEQVGMDKLTAGVPVQRIGDEDDLRGAAVLFASDAGKHITGQIPCKIVLFLFSASIFNLP
jgi:hypothetical protein